MLPVRPVARGTRMGRQRDDGDRTAPGLPEPGLASPLDAALAGREAATPAMVDRAIAEGRVTLAYQPVVQANAPDRVAFHEALLRIVEPDGRTISAGRFIDGVEARATGRQLDTIALSTGLAALRKHPGLRLAVNMSARSIGFPAWTAALERGLQADPTAGERLILEITERSALVMPDVVASFMARLQARGVTFALDDFGAGVTSLRHMRDFCFDIVKIDGGFVKGVDRDPDNHVLCAAIVSIARHFDMFTVAERVETATEAATLAAMGVDCLQGYHFAIPTTRPDWMEEPARRRA